MTREELNKKKQKLVLNHVKRTQRKAIFSFLFKFALVLFVFFISFFLLNKYIFTKIIVVKEKRLVSEKLPSSFNGLKVIQFSDLHYGTTIFVDDVKYLVNLINERTPDLVVFTGDLIDKNYKLSNAEQEQLIKLLSSINASLGKYAIFGEEDSDSFQTIFNQSDFKILNNDFELVYNNSDKPILITGISSYLSDNSNIDDAFNYFNGETYNSNIYTISLTHEPDLVNDIKNNYSADLYLSGHSHNNSIRYPWGGSPYKIDGALTYNEEYYKLSDSHLFVSSGIGTNGNGVRLFCFPSINFFRISNE